VSLPDGPAVRGDPVGEAVAEAEQIVSAAGWRGSKLYGN